MIDIWKSFGIDHFLTFTKEANKIISQDLQAINLGDSGFMIVRDGAIIFESPVQLHGFNFTYQLERGNQGDLPSSGQVSLKTLSNYSIFVFIIGSIS